MEERAKTVTKNKERNIFSESSRERSTKLHFLRNVFRGFEIRNPNSNDKRAAEFQVKFGLFQKF